ncbi:MAG: helix-turn-helix domain-containing protein [Hyphomicrobiaceae bacterium]
MPHIIVEYSANLDTRMNMSNLLSQLHAAALETGVFPIGGLRTRAARRDQFAIADSHPDNAFIHVQVRLGHGRTSEVRQKAAEHIFATLKSATADVFAKSPLGLTLELVEIDPIGTLKHNNLHTLVEARATGPIANFPWSNLPINEQITAAREMKKLSQADLARKLDLSRSTISQWEKGQTAPSRSNIKELARVLELPDGALNLSI